MGQPDYDEAAIRALAALLHEMDLTEIEVVDGDGKGKLRVVRQGAQVAPPAWATIQPPSGAQPGALPAGSPKGAVNAVLSPMVGTAYLRPEPGAAPFVDVGDEVRAGQVVMIVEAMKTMNQIVAERGGTIEEIFVEDGQPVEYGEPLLSIA